MDTRPADRLLVPTALLGVSLVLRLISIGQESFYYGEGVTLWACQARTLPIVLSVQAVPPLYYYLMDVWSAIFGLGHVSLRVVSAVGGALGPVFIWWAAKSLRMSRGAAIVAAAVLAVSPLSVWFSQFAREFSLTATIVAAWLWLVARVAHEGSKRTAVALALTTFLGFSMSYHFAAVILGGLPALLLIARRARSGADFGRCARAVGAGMALWLLYTPFLIVQTFAQFQRDPASVTVATVNDLAKIFTDALTVGPFNTPTALVSGLVFVFYAQVALGLILFFSTRGAGPPAVRRSEPRLSWAFFLFCSAVIPILVLFAVSRWAVFRFSADRTAELAAPALFLFVFYLLDKIPRRRLGGLLVGVSAAVLLSIGVVHDGRYWTQFQEFDWRGAAMIVESEWAEGDALVFLPGWMGASYTQNGGQDREPIIGDFERLIERRKPTRLWEITWEQNPDETEKGLADAHRQNEGTKLRVDFPHIRLWEIPWNP